MSGRAIILVVAGIIVISSVILFRIEAASKYIVENSAGYYKKEIAHNIAQSGVNLALRQLGNYRYWRTGFSKLPLLTGKVTVVLFDTTFMGIDSTIGIRSTATVQESTFTSTAFAYFPPSFIPTWLRALITLNRKDGANGNINIDGRDHNPFSAAVNAGQGTYGIWSTASTFNQSGGSTIGGTVLNIDLPPANPALPGVIQLNQTDSIPFPTSPDSAFGGAKSGFPEGMLKAIAKSGVAGSQYTTDPATLSYPLSGVTYVEMPNGSPKWNATNVSGTGILVIHNSAHNANFDNSNGAAFSGIVIGDDVTHLHGDFWGAIMSLSTTSASNVLGNGTANIYYSRKAILNALGMLVNGTQLKVIAWWE
ncbi:MAG: hypothetical protein HY033_12640 [Ignavibacteriae bacterium]|nr:hypothetical protein [Ignavibacteria bacterium]MBI3365741.1 hypothetical protein [Ignavibacteriota bacterium]